MLPADPDRQRLHPDRCAIKIQHGIEILNSPAVRMTNCLVMMGFLAVMGWASAVRAATWRVDSAAPPGGDGRTWAGAFSRADAALASAQLGDVVWFRAGTHLLDGVLRPPSGVTLHGGFAGTESSPAARTAINFAHETVLRQTKAGAAVVEIAGGRDVQLDGLTLTGAVGAPGLILRDCDETVAITWCRVTKNTAPVAGGGIRVIERSRPRVFNVQISENRATGDAGGGGLYIDKSSAGTWEYGIVNDNVTDGAAGGGALILGPAVFTRFDFYFNAAGASGSAVDVGASVQFRDSVFCSNLARVAAPGAPMRIRGDDTRVILSGGSYVIGNVRNREAPEFASELEGEERVVLRDDAIVSRKEAGPADPTLLGRRDEVHAILWDVFAPPLTVGEPAPGRWVKQTLPGYEKTAAYHCLYLPTDWQPGKTFPVLAGFPGNGPFRNRYGDRSGGMPEDNSMGVGLSGGKGFIVVGLGYLDSRKNLAPTGSWWGDVAATIGYTKEAVRFVNGHYGGDPEAVVLYGFSRSAIGASFVGLYDDSIAPLWRAFLCYDGWESQADMARDWYRYDQSSYGYDPKDFGGTGVAQRFARVAGRPVFILGGRGAIEALNTLHRFPVELMAKPHRNHHTSWALRDTPERARVRAWLTEILARPAR